jgi:small subunit ribosomal protein S6
MAETAIHSYETIFIIDSTLEPDAIAAKKDKFVKIITDNGEIGEVEEWGKRKLAYPINFKTEGYYVLVNFKANVEFPKELDRRYRIDENILRTIIIRKDEV